MTQLNQVNTQVDVNAPAVRPAAVAPTNFTDVIKAGANILSSRVKDLNASVLSTAISGYSVGMEDLRDTRGTDFNDEDIRKYNKQTTQQLSIDILGSGGSVKDLNAALTAFGKTQESSDQYEIIHKNGFTYTTNKATGKRGITAGPEYADWLRAESQAALPPELAQYRFELAPQKQLDFDRKRVLQAGDMDAIVMSTEMGQAKIASMEAGRMETKLAKEELFIQLKTGVFKQYETNVSGLKDRVNLGELRPDEAISLAKQELEVLRTDPSWVEMVYGMGQDPDAVISKWETTMTPIAEAWFKSVDPKNKEQYKALYEEAKWKATSKAILNGLNPQAQNVIAVAQVAPGLKDVALVLKSLSPEKTLSLALAKADTVREIQPILGPLAQPTATKEDWDKGMVYLDRVLMNANAEYNLVGKDNKSYPIVSPAELQLITTSLFGAPGYQEHVLAEKKALHQQLLRQIRTNYSNKPGALDTIDFFIKDVQADSLWDWLKNFNDPNVSGIK